jgi:hypothetical protein
MTLPRIGDLVKTSAEILAHEESERAERRRQELAEQRSQFNPPNVRIRAWEKIHQLRLPSDPAHPVLSVIAVSTGLTLAEVREEQRTRAVHTTSRNRE